MRGVFVLVFAALLTATLSWACPTAHAEMETAYVVASDEVFAAVPGLREYLKDGGIDVVQVRENNLAEAQSKECYIVIGKPDDKGALGDFIRASLTPKQLENAKRMGKAELVVNKVGTSSVMFFVTQYSLQTFVKGTASSWKEFFEDWYGIPLSITQIIGY